MFTQKFGRFVCEGDTITCEVDGFTCTATLYLDDSGEGGPDERYSGFWPSLDPKDAGYIGPRSKSTLRRHMAKAKEIMRAWNNDEWHYFGVAVTVERDDMQLTGQYGAHALWGIEGNYPGSDNDYLREVANELLPEALDDAKAKVKQITAQCSSWNNDTIQFPRLLAELRAVSLTRRQYDDLAGAMDLSRDEIDELFERAETTWQEIKRNTMEG